MKLRGAVCFLVINQIDELPRLSIKSALRTTNLPILVGYIADADICSLRDLPVQFVKIHEVEESSIRGQYSAFDQVDFYRIVMNKWELLLQNIGDFDFLIYSDIDVIWIQDAGKEVEEYFSRHSEVDLLMQSFGASESSPSLCMGFIGIRNTKRSSDFLSNCKHRHKAMIKTNSKVGDDDIATLILKELGFPQWLHRLSPLYFPVGNLLNLYASSNAFPGINPPKPFIFHLNYVVGLQNKRLMARVLSEWNPEWAIDSDMTIKWRTLLVFKKLKFSLGRLRRLLS